jgi:hypothetical protein
MIGSENPVNAVTGDGPKSKSSGDHHSVILSDIFSTLLPPQYEVIFGFDVVVSKQLYPGFQWSAMSSSVSFLSIST